MPASKTILANLRRTQSFDSDLRAMDDIDRIADEFTDILFQSDTGKRQPKIETLVERLVNVAEKRVLPQAEKIGQANAVDLIKVTPKPTGINLNDPDERAQALTKGRRKIGERLEIIRQSIKANGVDLDAALTRYWLEPSEGKEREKLERLKRIHERMERERKQWETQMRDFHNGVTKSRPKKPPLDFLSAMTAESKSEIRQQARRTGTDAEIAVFQARGHKNYVWITPNGAAACPDCQNRQNVVLTIPQWESIGRPGSGKTICQTHCFCMLVPRETVTTTPNLLSTSPLKTAGPLTSPDELALLNTNRIGATSTGGGPVDTAQAKSTPKVSTRKPKPKLTPTPAPIPTPKYPPGATDLPVNVRSPVSAEMKKKIADTLNTIPENWRAALKAKGAEVVTADLLTDARPELKGVLPRGWAPGGTWDMADGCARFNQAYVTEHALTRAGGTKYKSTRIEGVLRHELGHVASNLHGYLHQQKEFYDAYQLDLSKIPLADRGLNSVAYYVQPGDAGLSETFAEGFANLCGGGCERGGFKDDFAKRFSNSLAKIKEMMDRRSP